MTPRRDRWLRRLLPGRRAGEAAARRSRAHTKSQGDRILVAGWFSWSDCGATAGDLLARDVVCDWLDQAGRAYDVANDPPFTGGVDWRAVEASAYSDVVFVCGPVGPHTPIMDLLERFPDARWVGLDLSMIKPLDVWNPFDLLFERDSSAAARPDLAMASRNPHVPLLGVVLVEPYPPEYEDRDMQQPARDAALRLADSREAVRVTIDTRLNVNTTGLRTAREVESLIARMDAVVTTRLHGLVLALKNGVPVVAVDPVAGGAKIRQQAEVVGWPHVVTADEINDDALDAALDFCLSEEGRTAAQACAERAKANVEQIRFELIEALSTPPRAERMAGDELQAD